jgi:O-antigen ligase
MTHRARSELALPGLAAALAWSTYLPLGWQYAGFLGCALASCHVLAHQGQLGRVAGHPLFLAGLALWGWLAVSAVWTRAPMDAIVSHLWMYALPLWVVPIALALPGEQGRAALRHFVAASVTVAMVMLTDAVGLLPEPPAWRPFVDISGNQRIVHSLLLALGASLAVWLALHTEPARQKMLLLGAAVVCLIGLTLQDRRTGMLAAPALLAVLALTHQRSNFRRLAVLSLIGCAVAAVWLSSEHVRQRFDEGVSELLAYRSDAEVDTSWGMRARMLEVTARLVLEHPLAGHGVGSWVTEWRQRVAGSAALEAHTTPHNEYLLLAMQGGAVALALALVLWLLAWRGILRGGRPAVAALLVLVALSGAACFNVVLRDAKFALPLLGLAALAWAASRSPGRQPGLAGRECTAVTGRTPQCERTPDLGRG